MVENDISFGKEMNGMEYAGNGNGNSRQKPLIIAHRGASRCEPENTIAAFRRAVEDGADGIELDVRLAADGVAVVIHDRDLKRTAGISGRVSSLSSEQLSMIDVGTVFRKNGTRPEPNHRLPTLIEVLRELNNFPGLIYIELKCKERDAEQLAVSVSRSLSAVKLAGEVVIKSFRLSALAHFRRYSPNVRTAALFAPRILAILRKEKHLVKIAAELGVSELSLHRSLVTRKLMKKASRRGLPVAVWTADNPRWVKRAIRLGVKAIITNDPARLLKRRNELAG